jgi:tellurite resistance protein TerC
VIVPSDDGGDRGPVRRPRWGSLSSVAQEGLRQGRRLVILVVGGTVLLIGTLLLVLPGPGIPIVVGGLAILAIEFAWARRWLRRGRVTTKVYKRSLLRRWRRHRDGPPPA